LRTALKRIALLVVLFTCAMTWTCLMSINFGRRQGVPASGDYSAEVTYVDRAAFPDVTTYVSVLDGTGQRVQGLGEAAFSVYEDGREVGINTFIGSGIQPVTAVMLIDRSGSMRDESKMDDAIAAAVTFLDSLENGRDRLGVIAFNQDTEELGALALMDGTVRSHLHSQIAGLQPNGNTAYYDAVYEAVDMLQGVSGRKVVLALTDGEDTSSTIGSWHDVVEHAQTHNVVAYTIGLGGDVNRSVLRRMAEETGGEYYEEPSGSQLAELYADIAESLQDEYSLTYTSLTPQYDGTTRQVEVSVEVTSGTVSGTGSYAVGGTLTPSLSAWPCLGILPLLVLLVLPSAFDLVRGKGKLAQPEPALAPAPPAAQPPQRGRVEVPAAEPSVTCPKCGALLRPGARFCGACGAAPSTEAAVESVCVSCGAPLRVGAKFCQACGTLQANGQGPVSRAGQQTCTTCGAALKPTAKFCAKCGHRV
jgi:Ca-activated chloride channel family protein